MLMARLVISQNERLLLHLLETDKYRDMAQVPMTLCQEGIAKALGTKVHNVSRALSPLEADGLVTDRLSHVQGARRRRRTYVLTEKGRVAAEAIRERVEKSKAAWQEDGLTNELPIGEILRRASVASGRVPSILEIVDTARRGGALAPSVIVRKEDKTIPDSMILERSHGRPMVDRFFGRVSELSSIMEALSSESTSVVQVHGMPGIGKSTLLSKAYDALSGKRALFWYTFREWDSEEVFVETLAAFLSDLGCRRLARSLKTGTMISDMHPQIVGDFRSVDAVLFLDDVHKVADRMELLLTMLIDAVKASASVKLILITRTAVHLMPKHASEGLSVEVGELDRKSAKELVASAEVADPDELLRAGHGHPMLLNLMIGRGAGSSRRDVIDYFDGEIYSSLPASERRVLELLSIYRNAVPIDALEDVEYETISLLRRRSLISEQDGGIWVHDLLRDYMVSRLSAKMKGEAHIAAGRYCESRPEAECKLEALQHFIKAGRWVEASRVAVVNGDQLAEEYPSETHSLLSRIPEGETGEVPFFRLLHLRGRLLEGMGRHEEALADYESSASMIPEEDEDRAMVIESIARLQAETDELSKSMDAHQEALALYEKAGDVDGMVREWLNIGVVMRRRGEANGARECYGKALSIATKAENRAAQGACLNNIAILDWEEGKPGDAERRFRESMRFAHSAKDHYGEAKVLENYAQLCRSFNRLDESRQLLLESSDAYFRASDVSESKKLRAQCAEIMADMGRLAEAIELCRKALSDRALRRRKGLLHSVSPYDSGDTHLILTLAGLLRMSGDHAGATALIREHVRTAEDLADPVLMAKLKLEQAMIAEESGDLAGSVTVLDEADEILSRAGDREGLIAVHMRLGTVREKLGELEVAAHHYSEAARHAEIAGNQKARLIALDNLRATEVGD